MFRKSRAPSTPTSPTSPSTGHEGSRTVSAPAPAPAQAEISDDYEVVQTPSGSNPNSSSSSNTPPPNVRQASSRDDWYPSWLPRRPLAPAPASTVPSERGHGNSPTPHMPSTTPSNAGTSRGGRPTMASGAHRVTPSYDTGYTGYTGESGEYVDIGEYDIDPALAESEGTEERVGIGRRQTPRSVRIISEATAAASSRRRPSSRHSRRPSSSAAVGPQVRSRKEGRTGHVHGSGPKPWWRGTVSTPLSPTVVSPSPFPGGLASGGFAADVPPPSVPPHMRAYMPHPGMSGVPTAGAVTLRPRFRAPGLDLGFISTPSVWMRFQYILWPIWVYGLVVVQSFLDLNAIYALVQLALHPTPMSPPSSSSDNSNPSSSRNWALAAAGYGICWLFWIVGIVLLYEVVYSWWRRWRCKRPLMIPLYLSAPAFNIVCMTSFENFCFFRYIRSSARPHLPLPRLLRACGSSSSGSTIPSRAVTPSALSATTEPRASHQHDREQFISPATAEGKENMPIVPSTSSQRPIIQPMSSLASWGDWFAETCFFYGQNLPTVSLLLPRAALSIAILLAFTTAPPEDRALGALGLMKRDRTFFRTDGSLSGYARGVLLANVAWAAWRVLILLISWIGLWWMSGHACAGICGPRFRWEEPEEKPGYAGRFDEEQFEEAQGVLATWSWRECTRARVYDAYDLCLFLPPPSKSAEKRREVSAEKSVQKVGGGMDEEEENAVLDRVLAAAGLPTVPTPSRRGKLRGELFNTPPEMRREISEEGGIQEIIVGSPKRTSTTEGSSKRSSRERRPPNLKPYPFTTYPSRQGSQDSGLPSPERIPFPPSPRTSKHSDREGAEREVGIEVEEEVEEEEVEEEDVEEEDDEYDGEEGYDEFGLNVEEPSSGRNSASMSSLGQQVPSRFPFQFRHISRRSRGGRSSVGTQQSRSTSNKTSSASYGASHASRTVSSSDRRQSQVSDSPWSQSQRSPEASAVQSPVSPREAGGTESSSYGSPISGGHLGTHSPIPMPPRATHKARRQRASMPTVPVSAIPAAYSGVRSRSRTMSGGTQASSGLNLSPHPQYEGSSSEEEGPEAGAAGEFGMLTDPEAEGSQEEAEREDSVGLLSGGPSPRSSLGALRSRSNLSLTNLNLGIPHSRRSRQSSASSMSNSRSGRGSRSASFTGSGSQADSARSRSMSAQARSRAQSLVQGLSSGSRSHVSFENGMRSRASSLARLSEVPSVHRRSNESGATGSRSVISPSQSPANPEDYTFGQPIRLRVDSGSEGERRKAAQQQSPRERSPPSRRISRQGALEVESVPTVCESPSRASDLAPSEHSQQTMQQRSVAPGDLVPGFSSTLPIPAGGTRPSLQGGPSFISSAHESLITQPTSQEGSSDTAGHAPSSYGTITFGPEHIQGRHGSEWRPA